MTYTERDRVYPFLKKNSIQLNCICIVPFTIKVVSRPCDPKKLDKQV